MLLVLVNIDRSFPVSKSQRSLSESLMGFQLLLFRLLENSFSINLRIFIVYLR